MMKKKRGRPKLKNKREKFFSLRLTKEEAEEIQNAINKSNQSKSTWIKEALQFKARKTISKTKTSKQ